MVLLMREEKRWLGEDLHQLEQFCRSGHAQVLVSQFKAAFKYSYTLR